MKLMADTRFDEEASNFKPVSNMPEVGFLSIELLGNPHFHRNLTPVASLDNSKQQAANPQGDQITPARAHGQVLY